MSLRWPAKEVALRVVPVGNLDAVAGRLIARRVTGQTGADIFIITGGHPSGGMGAAGRGTAWIVAGIRGSLPTSGTGRRAVRRASGARPRPFLVYYSNNCTGHHTTNHPKQHPHTRQNDAAQPLTLYRRETIFQKGQSGRTGMALAGGGDAGLVYITYQAASGATPVAGQEDWKGQQRSEDDPG